MVVVPIVQEKSAMDVVRVGSYVRVPKFYYLSDSVS